jgi:hypothetical protein
MRNAKRDRAIERRLSSRAEALKAALLLAATETPRPPAMAPRTSMTVQVGNVPLVLIRDDCSAEFRGTSATGVQIRVWRTWNRGGKWRAKLTMKGFVRDSANVDTPQDAIDSAVRALVADLKCEAAEAWARLELASRMVNDG